MNRKWVRSGMRGIYKEFFYLYQTEIIIFTFLGIYLFTIQYSSRNCGALALCGPTVVDLYQNNIIVRTFKRNLAIENKSDTDMFLFSFLHGYVALS